MGKNPFQFLKWFLKFEGCIESRQQWGNKSLILCKIIQWDEMENKRFSSVKISSRNLFPKAEQNLNCLKS